ncbi:LysR family transcriptional regulator [Bradyrhizobium denitrificans]
MDLRQLRYFLSVIEQGSISKAADVLHVAQSAISLHLNRLEAELGCDLVHRTSRGIMPTESGVRLATRARSLLADLTTIADDVRGNQLTPSGRVVIGMPTSLGIALTVPLALKVRQVYPKIQLRITEGLSGHMSQWLLSGELDLALTFNAQSLSGAVTEHVARENLHLVASDAASLSVDMLEASVLFRLPLILPGRPHGLREEVERAALRHSLRPNVVLEVDSLESIKALVAENVGYTILSHRVASHGGLAERLRWLEISQPKIERVIYLARPTTRPLSSASKAIHAALLELLSTDYENRSVIS